MQTDAKLKGRRVLIVEDEWLVAMEMESLLSSLGCTVLGPAATLDAANAILARGPVDAALLDLNLSGTSASGLATRLTSAGARVIVVTGYGTKLSQSPELEGAVVLEKPVDYPTLIDTLEAALA